MGVIEKIKEIEEELKRTQVNKATEYHICNLKARLAKLRTKLLEPPKGQAVKGEGFDVAKFGSARICLIGFPSVGKSTLLTKVTKTSSQVAEYEFTTLTCIPGVIEYKGCKLQLLDLPGIIEGAADGKGRGRQVIAVAKGSDMILMVLDASKAEEQKLKLTKELEKVGIRLNRKKPDINITINKTGGVQFNSVGRLTYLNERIVKNILGEYKIHNAQVLVKDDSTVDDLIDTIEGNRKYINCLYVYNKIDTISMEDVDQIARKEYAVVISCNLGLNLEYLLDQCWEKLGLTRIYTKRKGCIPDFREPLVLSAERNGVLVQSFCEQIHREFTKDFKFANVWGRSVKHAPQRVGLAHPLCDEDVVQIIKVVKKK